MQSTSTARPQADTTKTYSCAFGPRVIGERGICRTSPPRDPVPLQGLGRVYNTFRRRRVRPAINKAFGYPIGSCL